ncbi:MAG: DEAD/DEAH box helicase family protein [Eubacterium sp.]|jgi:N12 class adenine-specific DNA methylase|nr:DEAD/DEAH box helicase family protein [Eubacterium sp.]
MNKKTHLSEIYKNIIENISSPEEWQKALRATAEYWKIGFAEAILIYAQNPDAKSVAELPVWNKFGRYIFSGEKAIAVLDKSNNLRYYFDESQTYGRQIETKWRITQPAAGKLTDYFGYILSEDFKDFEDFLTKRIILNAPLKAGEAFIKSCQAFVYSRCGIDLPENFLSDIVLPENIPAFGHGVNRVCASVLYELEIAVRRNEHEREHEQEYRHNLHERDGRHSIPGYSEPESIDPDGTQNFDDAEGNERAGGGRRDDERPGGQDLHADSREGNGQEAKIHNLAEAPEDGAHARRTGHGSGTGNEQVYNVGIGTSAERGADNEPDGAGGFSNFIEKKEKPLPVNFRFSGAGSFYASSEKAKFRDNIEAIRVLQLTENERRYPTPEEQAVMARYVGWGGLSKAFDESAENWHKEYTELKNLLSKDEWDGAMRSTLTAYYTDHGVIARIYDKLSEFGFTGGRILDPSMGTGNFFSVIPKEISDNSRLTGYEIDKLTGRLAKKLYPNAEINIKGFEFCGDAPDTYDAVVSNVPFLNHRLEYAADGDSYLLHDYFFVKSLDLVKPGGIVAFITSKGTLEKETQEVRKLIAGKAELLGAVRFPNDAFKAIAGTQVTTDLLILKKYDAPKTYENNYPDWVSRDYSEGVGTINRYFINNPDMVLGTQKLVSSQFGFSVECFPDGGDLNERLDRAFSKITGTFTAEATIYDESELEADSDLQEDAINAGGGVEDYTYTIYNSILYYCESRKLYPTGRPAADEERIKAMLRVLDALKSCIHSQSAGLGTDEREKTRADLNKEYDEFVKKYGYLNSRKNFALFSDDVRSPLLLSVEIENEDFSQYGKADIFFEDTIRPFKDETFADNAIDGLNISLNRLQRVDIDYISKICIRKPDEIITELGDKIYLNPQKYRGDIYDGWETASEYLSGDVKRKLAQAMLKADTEPEIFRRNVEALKANQPPYLNISAIEYGIGTVYIPAGMYREFMYETFETRLYNKINPVSNSGAIDVVYNKILNQWTVSNKARENSVKIDEVFGTGRINAYAIFEQSLNQKRVEVKDAEIIDDKKVYKLNKKETLLARDRQAKIEREFKKWVVAVPERAGKIEKIYNDNYNNIVSRKFDGSYLTVKGFADGMSLRGHQLDAVARIVETRCALVAHEVGAGKTAVLAAAGMKLRELGAVNKPLYVVPKPITLQWAKEFQRFFPTAKILVTSERDFEKKNRQRFLSKIATGNFDAVIMSQSQFEKIPLSLERQEEMFQRKISDITYSISEMKKAAGNKFGVKKMAQTKMQLEDKLQKLRADFKKDKFITFEELGCDFLFCDEFHAYKNLAVFSKLTNVAGINTSANSQRATDMEMKIRYLQELHNGGGAVGATGTPVSNSLSELFVMQHFFQPAALRERSIDYFDSWASVFGKITAALELKPSGDGFRMKTRFSSFHNLPELCTLFGEFMDIQKTAGLGLKLPQVYGGKPQMIVCEKSFAQEMQTQIGMERAHNIECGLVSPEEDNILAVCTYMTKVALDGRINDPKADDFAGSKLNICAGSVIEIASQFPDSAQVIFCDTNTPKKDSFSVYNEMKKTLVESGKFKEDEIAFIHDADTDPKRIQLFKRVNKAEIKIIIGSTGKLGTGVNIQERLVALHHLDAPYRPADLEQRNGRGIRQGNANDFVFVNYYSTKGTFDAYRWQLLEKKQFFISQILSGKPVSRSCEDIDESTLNYAEMKAATTENPLIAEKLTVDNEVDRLTLLKNDYISGQRTLRKNLDEDFPKQLEKANQALSKLYIDLELADKANLKNFHIKINGKVYSDKETAGEKLLKIAELHMKTPEFYEYEKISLGHFHGFEILLYRANNAFQLPNLALKNELCYISSLSESRHGNLIKLENLISKMPNKENEIKEHISGIKANIDAASSQLSKAFEHEDELNSLLERQQQINMELEFGEEKEAIIEAPEM